MGQYWQVISPDRREQLTTLLWGKLGCILPGGYAGHDLQQQLMVPLHKQYGNTDKASSTLLIANRRMLYEQSLPRNASIETKLGEYLSKLQDVEEEEEGDDDEDNSGHGGDDDDDTVTIANGDIRTLLKEIYSKFCSRKADVCPGDFFGPEDIPALMTLLFDYLLGIWANERIICIGDYSDTRPPDCASSSESLYNLEYKETTTLHSFGIALLERFKPCCVDKAGMFQREYTRIFEQCFPSQQKHVLLNFNSQEYVLSRDEFSGKELGKKRDTSIPGLGDAAMSRICWSQDPSTAMASNYIDVKGEWACHRFAIISLSMFDEVVGSRENWTDVSDVVYELLDNIWVAEGYKDCPGVEATPETKLDANPSAKTTVGRDWPCKPGLTAGERIMVYRPHRKGNGYAVEQSRKPGSSIRSERRSPITSRHGSQHVDLRKRFESMEKTQVEIKNILIQMSEGIKVLKSK